MKGFSQDSGSKQSKSSFTQDLEGQRKLFKALLPDYEICTSPTLLNEGAQTDLTKDGVDEVIDEFSQWSPQKEVSDIFLPSPTVSEYRPEHFKDDAYLMPDFIGIKFSEKPRILLKNSKKKTTVTIDPENLEVDEIVLKVTDWPIGELTLSIGGFDLFPRYSASLPDYLIVTTESRKYSLDEDMFHGNIQRSERQKAAWRQKERMERKGIRSPRTSKSFDKDDRKRSSETSDSDISKVLSGHLRSEARYPVNVGVQTVVQINPNLTDGKLENTSEVSLKRQVSEILAKTESFIQDDYDFPKKRKGIGSVTFLEDKTDISDTSTSRSQDRGNIPDTRSLCAKDKKNILDTICSPSQVTSTPESSSSRVEEKTNILATSSFRADDESYIPHNTIVHSQQMENIPDTSTVCVKDERYIPDTSIINGKDKGNIPDTSIISGKDTGNIPDTSFISGKDKGNIPDTSIISGKDKGNIPDTSIISGKDKGNISDTSIISEKDTGNIPDTSIISGKDKGNIPDTSNISGKDKGNIPDTSNIQSQVTEKIPVTSCVYSEDKKTLPDTSSFLAEDKSNTTDTSTFHLQDTKSNLGSFGSTEEKGSVSDTSFDSKNTPNKSKKKKVQLQLPEEETRHISEETPTPRESKGERAFQRMFLLKDPIDSDESSSRTEDQNITSVSNEEDHRDDAMGTSSGHRLPMEDLGREGQAVDNRAPSTSTDTRIQPDEPSMQSTTTESASGKGRLYNPHTPLLEAQQELARPYSRDRQNYRRNSLYADPEDVLNKSPPSTPPK